MTSEENPAEFAGPDRDLRDHGDGGDARDRGDAGDRGTGAGSGDAAGSRDGAGSGDAAGSRDGAGSGDAAGSGDGADERGRLNLTDAKAIRALAHPVRWALLEALALADTLTATQASEMLGESPANCAFHLRTLAKYGFVEEAGGGRGRERPWRQTYDGMSWRTRQDDPQLTQAAEALDRVWLDRTLSQARRSLTSVASWPKALDNALGASVSRVYLTPAEAEEIYAEMRETHDRLVGPQNQHLKERRDPKHRPPDAIPVEFVLLGYPMFDLPPLPDAEEPGDAEGVDQAQDGAEDHAEGQTEDQAQDQA